MAHLTHDVKALSEIASWLTRNLFSSQDDIMLAGSMRQELSRLGLNPVLSVSIERACRLHIEARIRSLLQKELLPEHQGLVDVNSYREQVDMMDEDMEDAVKDGAIRPRLVNFIRTHLLEAYRFWSADDCEYAQPPAEESSEAWLGRFIYYLDSLLVQERAQDLFELIKEWPASMPAMWDLKVSVTETREKLFVASQVTEALQRRLLHPGTKTKDILQTYVSLVYAVRFIDPSGILLSRVSGPIRRYLRGRADTVPVIVASLLGDDEGFAPLRQELDAAGKGESTQNTDGDTSMIVGGEKDDDEADDRAGKGREALSSMRPIDYTDPNWEPRPVDAGPSYRQSKTADVIAMLVSIFEDKQSFVKALEVSTAKALLKTSRYDISREYRNNEVLKRRFGDTSLARCDVMLQDIVESRRVDSSIRRIMEAPSSSLSSSTLRKVGPMRKTGATSTFDALRPLITSRQFWPDLEGTEVPVAPGGVNLDTNQPATLASVGPPPGGMEMKLPGELGQALETYNRAFTAVRDSRRLRWLPGFGRVKVQIDMQDGRSWSEVVDPIKAAVLSAAGSSSSSPESPLSKAALAEEMNLNETSKELSEALRYWCTKNVLVEVEGRAGWYIECQLAPKEQ